MHYINFTQGLLRQLCILMIFAVTALSASTAMAEENPSIVVLGDSLVAGYQLPPGASFPEKLQAALNARGVGAKIVGAGVSGDTTSGGLARLSWSVADGTDAVILELE